VTPDVTVVGSSSSCRSKTTSAAELNGVYAHESPPYSIPVFPQYSSGIDHSVDVAFCTDDSTCE
jgi:hypothetical protein